MSSSRDVLLGMGLPQGDLHPLPDSTKRFPDGAQYRVEIPSTEGPECLRAVLEEASRLSVRVHRVSQGSGVFMLTDDELDEMASMAADAQVEVSLFARPNAGWDTSAMARAPAGGVIAASARGQDQVVAGQLRKLPNQGGIHARDELRHPGRREPIGLGHHQINPDRGRVCVGQQAHEPG